MRALPNIKIMNITDSNLAAKAAESSYHSNLTTYVRLDKDLYPCIHDESSPLGNGMKTVMEGQNIVLFSTGPITHLGIDVAKKIAHKLKFQIKVVDVFEIPINGKKLLEHASNAKLIFTLEEHFLPGGFGSAVCEVLADNGISIPVKRIGIDIQNGYKFCYTYGGRNAIRKCLGIDFDSIYSALTVKIAQFS
jgi:transketolase